MPRPAKLVSLRLAPALAQALEAQQARESTTATSLISKALDAYLQPQPAKAPEPVRPDFDTAQPLRRATLRIPEYVDAEAQQRAFAAGMSKSRWMAAAVQSVVATHPVLTDAQQQQFDLAIGELNAIGRNLNQIARALNQSHFETDRVKLQVLEATVDKLETLKAAQVELLKASRRYWGLEA